MTKSSTKTSKPSKTSTVNQVQTEDIVQPDMDAEDPQGYIRENAKKGEPIPVPHVTDHAIDNSLKHQDKEKNSGK